MSAICSSHVGLKKSSPTIGHDSQVSIPKWTPNFAVYPVSIWDKGCRRIQMPLLSRITVDYFAPNSRLWLQTVRMST